MSCAPGTVLARRYRLEQRISSDDYGEVWRGTDVMLNRPVAVKLLLASCAQQPETLARFRADALHAAAVAHGNIARIYDYAETDPTYLVMEFVAGPSLASLLARGPMEPAKVMDIVAQTASGLHAAHQAGLVHGDVKPGNLLLTPGSVVKITDFGINGGPASPASDLYALGVVAQECLMGAAPFAGGVLGPAFAGRDRPMPPLPGSVPGDVASLVGELTAKDPAQRPGSAGEVARRAARIRDGLAGGLALAAPPPGLAVAAPASGPAAAAPASPLAAARFIPPLPWQLSPWPRPPRRNGLKGRRSGWPGWPAWAAAGVIAALLGLVLAYALSPVPVSGRAAMMPFTAPGSSSKQPVISTKVRINVGPLIGQPVDQVVSKLRRLGLDPRVLWRASDQQPPGRVLSVQPDGQVAQGSVVTVLGAVRPRASHTARPRPAHPKPSKLPHRHHKDGHHHHKKHQGGG
jgi:serine/threonine-protein kinase